MVAVAGDMHEMGPTHELLLTSPVDAGVGRWILAGTIRGGRGLPADGPMRVLAGYAAVVVLRGVAGYTDADGRRAVAETGDVILVRPDVPHRYGTRGAATWDEGYVVFDGPLFDVCLAGGVFARTGPIARPADPTGWATRLFDLVRRVGEGAEQAALPAMLAFVGLLAELVPAAEPAPRAHEAQTTATTMARARALLASNLDRPLGAADVAAALGMPYERFRKAFRAHSCTSPARYRTERRIAAARELIRYRPDITNRELAELLGFSDEFPFSRRFAEHTGRPPRAFKAQMRDG
jgi:AraC-like DNA-binding protein